MYNKVQEAYKRVLEREELKKFQETKKFYRVRNKIIDFLIQIKNRIWDSILYVTFYILLHIFPK